MRKINWIIIAIVLLAGVLRFYKLGQNPPSLDWDETAHGYNAYSILKTGRDEYGLKFPLYFRSFDDYKPPVYTYLVVPSVTIFGLNDFAVRFPSALLGTFAILFTYLLAYELFKNKPIAYLSAFFLAISPWHLQFSRVAFETNSTITFSVLGTWAFLKGIKQIETGKKTIFFSVASLSFGINLFMYHNSRVFVPIFATILLIIFSKELSKNIKSLIIPAIIAAFIVIKLTPLVFSVAGQQRYQGTTIFADASPLYAASQKISDDQKKGIVFFGKLFHNRRLVYIPILIENYFSHFKPDFLFFNADMDRHHAPGVGLLYLWDVPFLICGIYFIIKKKIENSSKIIIFSWFFLGPLASAVTWGVPHALRSEIFLPMFQIFVAVGCYFLFSYTRYKKTFLIVATFLLLINFTYYLHQYYQHMPYDFSKSWLFGRKEAAQYTNNIKAQFNQVIVSTSLEQPHEFWLYYLKYDPLTYQHEGGTVSGGFRENRNHFDKFKFKPIEFSSQKKETKTLFVGVPNDFPQNIKTLRIINYLDGEPAIYIVDGDQN